MTFALLDILLSDPDKHMPEFTLDESIHTHLSRLLNTRRGSLQHIPDYGLPDMTEIYKNLPYSIQQLIRAIYETVSKFEPRLSHIKIHHLPNSTHDGVIHLGLEGRIKNGKKVNFTTYFVSGNSVKVMTEEKF